MGKTYTISKLAREFGVTPRALRFYEDKGLLFPERCQGNRVYSEGDRVRLQLVLQGKRVGLSLDDMREILELYREAGEKVQIQHVLDKCRQQVVTLQEQKVAIDSTLDYLQSRIVELDERLSTMEDEDAAAKSSVRAFDEVARASLDSLGGELA